MALADLAIAAPALPERICPWGALASLAFHASLAAALVLLSPLGDLAPPPAPVITVDIISTAEFAALQTPPAPQPAPDAETAIPVPDRLAPSPELVRQPIPENPTYRATQFYSASVLQDPENASVVRTLRSFTDQERIIQVCNVEAIEQIGRAAPEYVPDTVVGYAMSDFVLSGLSIIATGGAFRSRRRWYEISYTCTAAPNYEAVTAFEFQLGAEIPEALWEAHNLNASDEDGD